MTRICLLHEEHYKGVQAIVRIVLVVWGILSFGPAVMMGASGTDLAYAIANALLWSSLCSILAGALGSWSFLAGATLTLILAFVPFPPKFQTSFLNIGIPVIVTLSSVSAIAELVVRHTNWFPQFRRHCDSTTTTTISSDGMDLGILTASEREDLNNYQLV